MATYGTRERAAYYGAFEYWKPIAAFDGYEISTWGSARSLTRQVTCRAHPHV